MNKLVFISFIIIIILFIKQQREYDYKNKDRVIDLLPWVYPYRENIINKNGSIMKIFKFKNLDLESATSGELSKIKMELNNTLKRLGEGFVLNVEARRKKISEYPESKFNEDLLQKMDNERKTKNIEGGYFETEYYISISWFPPKDSTEKIKNTFMSNSIKRNIEEEVKKFESDMNGIELMLKDSLLYLKKLNTEEMLSYLKSCISKEEQPVKEVKGAYIDSYISDVNILPGLNVKVDDEYIGVLSILSFPDFTFSCMLDKLNKLNLEYRWNSRFIYIEDDELIKTASLYQKKYYSQRKGFFDALFEKAIGEEVKTDSQTSLRSSDEADEFQSTIQEGITKGGYYTFSFIIRNKDEKVLNEQLDKVAAIIKKEGFVVAKENLNILEAFLGSLPGDIEHNVRKPILLVLNYLDLIPLSTDWDGYKVNEHFKQEALLFCESGENTSFKFNLHVGDVGHSLILGPTGAGKSVLLTTLTYQFKKYKDSQVITFDKGGSSRVLTAGVGGKFYDFGKEKIGFQPLKNIHLQSELEWAFDWICNIVEGENLQLTSEHRKSLIDSLKNLSNMPEKFRTFQGLLLQEQNRDLRNVLEKYTKGSNGLYGEYFDNDYDDFTSENTWQVFEMENIFNSPRILIPLLEYLFHKIEIEMFNGKPTLLLLDECWLMLDNPKFAGKIREWVKVLRKKNVSVVFATQSLGDVAKSTIKDALFESCLTKIYLPNLEALKNETYKELYQSFGLNEKELEIIKDGKMKKDYYYKSQKGQKIFQLNLNKLELSYVGASSVEDQTKCIELLKVTQDLDCFNNEWQKYKGVQL